MPQVYMTRRGALGLGAVLAGTVAMPQGWAQVGRVGSAARSFDLVLENRTINVTGRERPAMAINGQVPGPVLRFSEGEEVIINVANYLNEHTSIHWHGLIIPSSQDGVPSVSDGFQGIPSGTTYQYRFRLIQAGTYWYHSHSASQEQSGIYGPIIIEPKQPDPFIYDRDYIIQLSDWTDTDPARVIANLKRDPGYYNYSRRTGASLLRDLNAAKNGAEQTAIIRDRIMWGDMRMEPTDIEDVTGYTLLVNGYPPDRNFTALFRPGERIRLRFINSSAMTYQDVRIPGLRMTVVQADGQNVQPVTVDEFRIAPAETLDVLVTPLADQQYQILGETMGRQGFARATLATREGLPPLPLPPHRPRPVLTMADMGMSFGPTGLSRGTPLPETDRPGHVAPMDMGSMDMGRDAAGGTMSAAMQHGVPNRRSTNAADHAAMGHAMPITDHAAMGHAMPASDQNNMAGMNHGGMAHGGSSAMDMPDPIQQDTGAPLGAKVLSYRDLKALDNPYGNRRPDRTIEVRLTGNMERYFWSINGNKYSEAQPIVFRYGERVRLHFINETMMNHPMHLHGMWMVPEVGNGAQNPLKHVVNIKPGTTLDVDVVADAEGGWAFHCHLLYHMETGMMRKVVVQRQPSRADL